MRNTTRKKCLGAVAGEDLFPLRGRTAVEKGGKWQMIDDVGWNMTNTEQEKDVFWYEVEIQNLTISNGFLIEKITELQEKIEHNLRRIKEIKNLIKKEK